MSPACETVSLQGQLSPSPRKSVASKILVCLLPWEVGILSDPARGVQQLRTMQPVAHRCALGELWGPCVGERLG